jgi:X-Pro dipeptidyl-peptidase
LRTGGRGITHPVTVKRARLPIVLAAIVAAALPAPASGGPPYAMTEESYVVPTRHGDLYVEVVRPVDEAGGMVRGPAIFTLSPYSILGRNGDASRWVPRGYVRVWGDVVGTGNSGGCYDYGGRRELETGYDLVEWIAAQPWSTGRVGMNGGSYNGTTATATAITRPPHLTTIVPEAGISRWYEYAYSGGIRYFLNNENPTDEGVDTPLAFDFGLAIPPPLDVTGPDWADRVRSTVTPCEELQHTQHGYDDTPDYDAFWLERDYIVGAPKVRIPVLVAHNWGDWNVKQEEAIKLYRALTGSANRKLYMGTRWQGHGRPGGDYQQTVSAWFDHYLMDVPNGIERMPDVHSQMSTYDGPGAWYAGPWPRTRDVTLFAQHAVGSDYQWRLLPSRPAPTRASPQATFVSTGTNTETRANENPRANQGWLWFETPALARDVRIFGEVRVRLWSTVGRTWITYTPTIVDIDPSRRVLGPGQAIALDERGRYSTTRGWLDSRYRQTLSTQALLQPGAPFGMTIVEKPQDYTFEQGHIIGLNVQTEINDWSLPKPYPDCVTAACNTVRINWEGGETTVTLPVVDPPKNAAGLFGSG